MSGSFVDANEADKAHTLAVGPALVAQAMAAAMALQAESGQFIVEYGAAVVNGHTPVDDVPAALDQG